MNTPTINVTRDGFVDIGKGQFVSLDKIQQAVLAAQNPKLTLNDGRGHVCERCRQTANDECNEDALPLPKTNWDYSKDQTPPKQPKQTINEDNEHLAMPSMKFGKR